MARPWRRLVVGVSLVAVAVLAFVAAQIGLSWKQALDNVDAMIVPTVSLPELPTEVPEVQVDLSKPEPTPAPTPVPAPDDPVNILLLGTDARPGEEVSRTDAIIVVHIDPRTDRVSMLSLPRDLWVSVPGYGKARINAAYPIGEKSFGKHYGPAMAKQTVSKLLDIPIHHFVLVNFDGFKTLIDRLGGITIDVPKEIDDPSYPTEDYRTIKVHFDSGPQQMDGDRALIYARTRHADSDFGRNQRQQQVLMAIFDRVRERGVLSQITSLDDYTDALRDSIRTDVTKNDMLSLTSLVPRLSPERVARFAIEPEMIVALREPATFAADPKALKQLVEEMLGTPVASAGGEDPVQK
ncbi:MAG TPA: LCP family protein [Roseiflexaceae bacterium]|nr:LCP family protein [Roseiflexaceae bacterium]